MTSQTPEQLSSASRGADWMPDDDVVARSRLFGALRKWGYSPDAAGFDELNARAVADPEWFWRAVVDDLDIEFSGQFDAVVDESDGKPFPRWFTGGLINVAELTAHRHARGPLADRTAVVYEGDSGARRTLTFAELDTRVRQFAANLAAMGVAKGDRVVLFMPVVPEAAVAFLAVAMLGAVAVPTFSGYAPDALSTRIQDSQARVLITADGTTRRGKTVPLKATADAAVDLSPTVEHVVVIRHLGTPVSMTVGRDVYYDELPADPQVGTAATESNDPLCLVYTSGTTGRPKGIVHSHGGFAVKCAVDFAYGFDVDSSDVVSWITDLGWLVGPMLFVGPLQLGATIVMVEGLPVYPAADRMWQIANRNGVTVQGIAPTAARAMRAADVGSAVTDVPTVKSFVSTGEAWDEPTWWWLFTEIGNGTRPIINFSGGTEVGGGLIIGYPGMPSAAAAFTGPLPGIDVGVVDDDGNRVEGAIGELAVFNTFPGMTHAFWGDRKRYLSTYWDRFEGVWIHGDLASVESEADGRPATWRIHGRSDDTLKLSGRRVGPAEIEAAVLADRRIAEVAVIGVPDEARGMAATAFVVLRDQTAAVDVDDLAATASTNAGRGLAPTLVVVAGLPKTKNGKIMRRLIRSRYLGLPTGDLSALDPATPIDIIPVHTSGE